jgi:hypothetical protein
MSVQTENLQNVRLGGFGHSAAEDATTAGRESVRGALGGRTPAAGDLVIVFPSAAYDLDALHRAPASAPARRLRVRRRPCARVLEHEVAA